MASEKTYILQDAQKQPKTLSAAPNQETLGEELPATPGINTNDSSQTDEEDQCSKGESNSLSATAFNYINSIIGSGVIGMPYALRQAGVGLGIFLFIFIALITDYSLILLVRTGHISGTSSYQGMVDAAFGKVGYFIITMIQFAYPFIAMVSYNVIVGDTVTQVVVRLLVSNPATSVLANRDFIAFLTTVFITLPLSLYRDIGKLAKASFVSMIFILFIVATVFWRMYTFHGTINVPDEHTWEFANPSGMLQAISIITFAFMCHHNTFLLYCSIENASMAKWNRVTHASILISLFTMGLMTLGGYATFTGYVQGDLLNNYCWQDDLMNVSRLLFSITILLTYPIECFVCREVVQNVIWGPEQFQQLDETKSRNRHVIITVIIVLLTFCFSTITDCLSIVLEVNGLVAAIPLAFVIPSICYLRLEEGKLWSKQKLPALLLAIFGIVATVIGTVTIIVKGPDQCKDVRDMPYCFANTTHI